MIVSIANWGNSLALRIPVAFARKLDLQDGASVDLSIADGALVVRSVAQKQVFDLDALLDGMTEENRHGEIAVGRVSDLSA
jgi:antitoxin MazE